MDRRLLSSYLNDHLAGSSAGLALFRRAARSHEGGDLGEQLSDLAREVGEDRDELIAMMRGLGIRRNPASVALGVIAERLGRLKPNGYVIRRSPLSDVVELEGMRAGVAAKLACWEMLLAVAAKEPRLEVTALQTLVHRAHGQHDRVRALHLRLAAERLART